MCSHEQLVQRALKRQLGYEREIVVYVADRERALVVSHTHIAQSSSVERQLETVVSVVAHEHVGIRRCVFVVHLDVALHVIVCGVLQRESDVGNAESYGERFALTRCESAEDAVFADKVFLHQPSLVGLLRLLHAHVAVRPVEVEDNLVVVLADHGHEVFRVVAEVYCFHGLHLFVAVAKDADLKVAHHRIVFPLVLTGSYSAEHHEGQSALLARAVRTA